jgi:Uma2 family endonuclease
VSTETTTQLPNQPEVDWEHPTPPTDLIFDDGEPLESNRHRIAMNVLIDSALTALADRPNSFAGGNMFVYYSQDQAMNRDFRGPDFFVALDVEENRDRKAWVTWQEGGRYPDVIVELMSPSTATIDRTIKKDLYERVFRTADYYVFDPFDASVFEGWHLGNQRYHALQPNSQGWLWCETLGLWLGTWEGRIRREPATGSCCWLRFYDAEGNLVLLPEEQAEQERVKAEQEYARAEQEFARAEQERARAEQEYARAEQEFARAEQERARAEQAEARLAQERERLRERLRASGIDPDEVVE